MRKDDWEVYTAKSIEQTSSLLQQHSICLGIIHFSETLKAKEAEQLEQLMRLAPTTVWVGITPPEQLSTLINARLIPGYFYDYHTEPVDWQRLSLSLGHAIGMAHANRHVREPQVRQHCNSDMIAVSEQMQGIFQQIRKIARVDASVMISGESGTGKELAARAIHDQSKRNTGAFITINCGAISPALIHSELFGHEKGAFTGAHKRKVGRLEAADGGTIFLDEVADLPLDLQVNLLRFLQERTIERVGGIDSISLDVRVLAASHIDLNQAVASGCFREDLFYRLNVIQLRIPPLRERIEDIEPLAQYFFTIFARERNHNVSGFSQQALQAMCSYNWPGNIRELINRVRRATIMCEHRLITPQELELPETTEETSTETLAHARIEAERQAIASSLRHSRNNISEAARRLGIARMTLYRLMQKHQLTTNSQDPASYEPGMAYTDR
jgi:DNA-binding NtrC family response regulator